MNSAMFQMRATPNCEEVLVSDATESRWKANAYYWQRDEFPAE